MKVSLYVQVFTYDTTAAPSSEISVIPLMTGRTGFNYLRGSFGRRRKEIENQENTNCDTSIDTSIS
jgi:hypothetical protein